MSGKNIATLYFYLVSTASLALIVTGIFYAFSFIINLTQFDKYPLKYGPGISCEDSYAFVMPLPPKVFPIEGVESSPSSQELEKQKEICLRQQALERKEHKIEDMKNAVAFGLIGLVLFSIHFPLARKQSRG